MLGERIPELLPAGILRDVRDLYTRAEAALGVVRFEWVHDGEQAWIVQIHSGGTDTAQGYITSKKADRWQSFDISDGLAELARILSVLPAGTAIALSGRVGLTTHFA